MEQINLPQKTKDTLDSFIEEMKEAYRNRLISVILYGSAASGEFAEDYSNVNLLVILDSTSLDNLAKSSKIVKKPKFRMISPLFFTENYIKSSLDVFPIEFLDMKENHNILFGKDLLSGLEVDIKNLRFQCEQELKMKLLNLKNAYLRSKNKARFKNLLFKATTSIVHILRNLLRLKGKKPFYLKKDVLNEVSCEFNLNIANLDKILNAKQHNIRLSQSEVTSLFSGLISDLEIIIDMIDKL